MEVQETLSRPDGMDTIRLYQLFLFRLSFQERQSRKCVICLDYIYVYIFFFL